MAPFSWGRFAMKVENAVIPPMQQALAFFGGVESGPFVMVNLLKFKATADYADGSEPDLSGAEAYARATARACASWSRPWAARSAIRARAFRPRVEATGSGRPTPAPR